MKSYYIIFYNGENKICGTYVRANDKEEALMSAEFSLMCRYPNVAYTDCKAEYEFDK